MSQETSTFCAPIPLLKSLEKKTKQNTNIGSGSNPDLMGFLCSRQRVEINGRNDDGTDRKVQGQAYARTDIPNDRLVEARFPGCGWILKTRKDQISKV